LLLGSDTRLFLFASSALGFELRLKLGFGLATLLFLFLPDALFLELHQLLQREEDRAFLLFGHGNRGSFDSEWRGLQAPRVSEGVLLATPVVECQSLEHARDGTVRSGQG